MWYLVAPAGSRLYLQPNRELKFGRKRGNVQIPSDVSLSRLHASVLVQPLETITIGKSNSKCVVKDLDSKYGTYVILDDGGTIRISSEGYEVKHGQRIRFGLQKLVYLVQNVPVITATSALSEDDNAELEELLQEIGGQVLHKWIKPCTHLTVSTATLTEKVVCAMTSAKPIVTMEYWRKVRLACLYSQQLPDPSNHIPPISEPLLDKYKLSLMPNTNRRALFDNLVFVFYHPQQYKTFGKIVYFAGGTPVLYKDKPLSNKELCAPNVIVVQYPNYNPTQSMEHVGQEYEDMLSVLCERKRKVIPESEIPLAILHCSTEKYCNPTFKFAKFLQRAEPLLQRSRVLVLDTQDVYPLPNRAKARAVRNVIPDTYDEHNPVNEKAPVPKPDGVSYANKCLVIRETYETSSESDKGSVGSSDTTGSIYNNDLILSDPNSSSFTETSRVSDDSADAGNANVEPVSNNSELLGESMAARRGTPCQEVIELNDDEPVAKKAESAPNEVNTNNNVREDSWHEKSSDLFHEDEVEFQRTEAQVRSDLQNSRGSSRESNERERIRLQMLQEKASSMRSSSSDSNPNDYEDIDPEHSGDSRRSNSDSSIEELNSSSDSSRGSTYFMRNSFGYKRFRKADVPIPTKRITLDDMYVWRNGNL